MFDVVTIGTATRDVFLTGKGFKVLKDKEHLQKIGFPTGEAECFALGAKIGVEEPFFTVGGGAANAAVTFARQGLKTAAVFKIGVDDEGCAIVETLRSEHVVPIAIKDRKIGTGYSTILLTAQGERTILVYRGAAEKMIERELPLSKLKADWVYIAPGALSLSLVLGLLRRFEAGGAKIAINPSVFYVKMGAKKLKILLRNVQVVILNREEGASLTGVSYDNIKGIFRRFDDFVSGLAILTDGSNGAWVSDGKYVYHAGVFREKRVADRTGAGDAFGSGFVVGMIEKNDVNYALRLAAANATSVVEQVGAQTGILNKKDFKNKRWHYLDLDVEPL